MLLVLKGSASSLSNTVRCQDQRARDTTLSECCAPRCLGRREPVPVRLCNLCGRAAYVAAPRSVGLQTAYGLRTCFASTVRRRETQ